MPRRSSALAGILLLLVSLVPAGAAEPAGATRGFALVPPIAAESLPRLGPSSPRAQAIRFADRVLERAPHAMEHVHVEGTLPHQGIYDESREALRDLQAARDLALAGRLTGDRRYVEPALRIIGAWVDRYRPSFNPIDETGFDALIIAFDLLAPSDRAPIAKRMHDFLHFLSLGYLDRMPSVKGSIATNNWQSHRIKLAVLGAYATADADLIDRARRAFSAQLAANLRPDGSTIDFAQRDAVHYAVYDLEPLAVAALAAAQHGENWYAQSAPSGASLPTSLDWLVPYADGSRSHAEFVHSTVRFDAQRRDAGLAGFDGDFEPKTARDLFAVAARLDTRYAMLSRKLGAGGPLLDLLWPLP